MADVITGPVLEEALGAIRAQAQQLETTRLQLSQHIRSLGTDRDKVVAALEAAQKELAGVKQRQKEADAIASRTKQEAQAFAAKVIADARAESGALLDAMRVRIASAQRALEAK